jgi:phage terminase large subunit-like protein
MTTPARTSCEHRCRPLSAPPRSTAPTLGPQVCRWIEANCVLGEGDHFGEPVRLRRWQKALLYSLYELTPTGRRRYTRALLELPKGNGKTPLAAAVALYELAGPGKTSPVIPVGAASFEQADLVFGDMKTSARESATLRHHLEVYDTEILLKGGPGRAYRVAAAAGTNDGQRPSAFVADELHEWVGNKERVHLVLANGTAKRTDSLQLSITTPGSDLDSLAGRLHTHGLRVNAGEVEDPGFLFVWFGAGDGYDLDDPAQLRQAVLDANPAALDFLDVDAVVARSAQIPRFEFERYHLGRWTRSDESWLPPGAWAGCRGPVTLDAARPSYVGVDMALKNDSIAVVLVQLDPAGVAHVLPKIWAPSSGANIDVAAVEQYLRELHRQYNVREFAYDPAYFERSAQALADDGLRMIEFPQSRSRMIPACSLAYEQIVAGNVRHDGNPTLTDHVESAVQRVSDQGWTLSKGRSRRKIDASIALVIALSRAHAGNAGTYDLLASIF